MGNIFKKRILYLFIGINKRILFIIIVIVLRVNASHIICCFRFDEEANDDDFIQPCQFWTKVLKDDEKERLVKNLVESLKDVSEFIQVKIFYIIRSA